jgi:hypothetical protein
VEQATFRCACCRRIKRRNPRVKSQTYCGETECQKERKRKWQREKMSTDQDYRTEQREAQRLWHQNNPDYWKRYRRNKQKHGRGDRQLQQKRDKAERKCDSSTRVVPVKMDTLEQIINDTTKTYLVLAGQGDFAKMDALEVKIIPVTTR